MSAFTNTSPLGLKHAFCHARVFQSRRAQSRTRLAVSIGKSFFTALFARKQEFCCKTLQIFSEAFIKKSSDNKVLSLIQDRLIR